MESKNQEVENIPSVFLPDGTAVPCLGQGTWHLGEKQVLREQEIRALRVGTEKGMILIDTAEMYGEGASEELIGEAIQPLDRDKIFLVSKVYPHNAGRKRIFESCKNSLNRLGTSYLDLYLLHWRGSVPLAETVSCMEELINQGLIRRWGVSNFDYADMKELWNVSGGDRCAVNQVLYCLDSRGIEYDLLPWQNQHHIPIMAYCPLAHGGNTSKKLQHNHAVETVAAAHNATPVQVLLNFAVRSGTIIAIPKSSTPEHTQENAESVFFKLTEEDLALLENEFPHPQRKMPLDIM